MATQVACSASKKESSFGTSTTTVNLRRAREKYIPMGLRACHFPTTSWSLSGCASSSAPISPPTSRLNDVLHTSSSGCCKSAHGCDSCPTGHGLQWGLNWNSGHVSGRSGREGNGLVLRLPVPDGVVRVVEVGHFGTAHQLDPLGDVMLADAPVLQILPHHICGDARRYYVGDVFVECGGDF